MRKFLVAVFFVLFAPLFVQAAQNIQINWDGQDHSREIVGNNPDNPLAIVGAGSLNAGEINGASLTVNGAILVLVILLPPMRFTTRLRLTNLKSRPRRKTLAKVPMWRAVRRTTIMLLTTL